MNEKYCQVTVSASNKKQAEKIVQVLCSKRLVAGTLMTEGKSKFWWNNKLIDKIYFNISCFSVIKKKEAIISEVRKIHEDKCPIIAFSIIDGNTELLSWIDKSVG